MKTVGAWLQGIDQVVKIGWPWHGRLEQYSPTACRLTTPAGVVIDFPTGDISHAISYPVSLTGAGSWRNGVCHRYQIPGTPPATTTAAEALDGMTWLNYFIESGIARFGGGYYTLIDESGKAWRFSVVRFGYRPIKIVIWHAPAGVFIIKNEAIIADPGFVRAISTLTRSGITLSSNGRLMAFNYYGPDDGFPLWSFTITITGVVEAGTLAASITRLVDSDISGVSGTTGSGTIYTFTGSWSQSVTYRKSRAEWLGTGWGAFEPTGEEQTLSSSGSYGPAPTAISESGIPSPLPPPADTVVTDSYMEAWGVVMGSYWSDLSGESVGVYGSYKCLGYFIGHDDQLVRVDQMYSRDERGTTHKPAGTADETMNGVIEYSDYVRVGSRESPRITVSDIYSGVNVATFTQYAGPRGIIVNCLADGRRGVALAQSNGVAGQYTYAYACCQVGDVALYPSMFINTGPYPTYPNFSVNPVTGEIFTRSGDGYPVSWV